MRLTDLSIPLTDAQWLVVTDNLGLCYWWAKRMRFRYPDEEFEEMAADGQFGLMRAAQAFDPDKGYRFSTYASNWIRQAMIRGADRRRGTDAHARVSINDQVSIDAPMGEDGDTTLGDVLRSSSNTAATAVVNLQADNIRRMVRSLPEILRSVLPLLEGETTAAELAREYGVTVEAIYLRRRQLVARIQRHLGLNTEAARLVLPPLRRLRA